MFCPLRGDLPRRLKIFSGPARLVCCLVRLGLHAPKHRRSVAAGVVFYLHSRRLTFFYTTKNIQCFARCAPACPGVEKYSPAATAQYAVENSCCYMLWGAGGLSPPALDLFLPAPTDFFPLYKIFSVFGRREPARPAAGKYSPAPPTRYAVQHSYCCIL